MTNTFMGLSKIHFLGLVILIMAASFASQTWQISKLETIAHQNRVLAAQGAKAHRSLCFLSNDLEVRVAASRDFLKLTVAQREAKFGKALGDIPNSVIRQSIDNETGTLKAIADKSCPPPPHQKG